jgi:hypothetical protein
LSRTRWRGGDDAAKPANASGVSLRQAGAFSKRTAHFNWLLIEESLSAMLMPSALTNAMMASSDGRCDQTIFDGSSAGFICQEFKENSLQSRILSSCAGKYPKAKLCVIES